MCSCRYRSDWKRFGQKGHFCGVAACRTLTDSKSRSREELRRRGLALECRPRRPLLPPACAACSAAVCTRTLSSSACRICCDEVHIEWRYSMQSCSSCTTLMMRSSFAISRSSLLNLAKVTLSMCVWMDSTSPSRTMRSRSRECSRRQLILPVLGWKRKRFGWEPNIPMAGAAADGTPAVMPPAGAAVAVNTFNASSTVGSSCRK
mmetsp:Transcript_65648/g.156927  ORF Transcript_65648/g.156927 Transcript_65648/m.156927 type:complete len:205 (+) Transcript_65648:938-1552(+)